MDINGSPQEADPNYYRNYIALWVIGTINNLLYVVVGSAAKDLAKQFDAEDYVGAITWATSASGTFCRLAAVAMQKIPYWQRVMLNTVFMLGGTILVAFAPNFGLLLLGIIFIGTSSTFGESVFLGYMRLYPTSIVGGWSSGTGMAGVGGAAAYLVLSTATKLSMRDIFLVMTPLTAVYYFTYAVVLKRPHDYRAVTRGEPLAADRQDLIIKGVKDGETVADEDLYQEFTDYPTEATSAQLIGGGARALKETRWARAWRCIKLVNYLSVQMGLVYYFEYIVSQGSAASAEPEGSDESDDFWLANSYKILAFCYQFGVLISRSSLRCVKIKKVEWLTVLQGANVILWLLQDKFHFMPLWVQFTAMIYVGLLGGASYVNVFHLLLEKPDIPSRDRELCVNIAAIYMNAGIILAGVTSIFIAKVVL